MEAILKDITNGHLVLCTREQYRSFARREIENKISNLKKDGNIRSISIMRTELERLDELHLDNTRY